MNKDGSLFIIRKTIKKIRCKIPKKICKNKCSKKLIN
jgi:hypothetical protein